MIKWKSPLVFRKRAEFLEPFAVTRGYEFAQLDDFGTIHYLKPFALSRWGTSRKVYNIITIKEALGAFQFRVMDFRYTYSDGKTTVHKDQSVFLGISPEIGAPPFNLKPENIFHKIGSLMGFQDIDFEEFPAFSDRYLLKSKDEYLTRQFFSEDLIHFFSRERKWHCEANNFYFVLYRKDRLSTQEEMDAFVASGKELYKLFKNNTFDLSLDLKEE
jgi:hypothetical protein